MFRFRTLALLALGVAVPSTVSCTAIFAPRDDVQRCGSGDDCEATGDARYVSQCVFDEDNLDLDTSQTMKICVAAFNGQIGCDPVAQNNDPVGMTYENLTGSGTFYSPMGMTCADLGGVMGCPPLPGEQCLNGLEQNEDGICSDGSGTVYSTTVNSEFAGQDVLDQHCRSFFCDESFVCDQESFKCVPCDPDGEFGRGGCGELYIGGEKSCVYQDAAALAASCAEPSSDASKVEFGACASG